MKSKFVAGATEKGIDQDAAGRLWQGYDANVPKSQRPDHTVLTPSEVRKSVLSALNRLWGPTKLDLAIGAASAR